MARDIKKELEKEHKELYEKIVKLESFLIKELNGETQIVSKEMLILMHLQLDGMRRYADSLTKRICLL